MAQTILTLCDPCLAVDGAEVPAQTWTVMVAAPGTRKATPYDVDVCPNHAKEYQDLSDFLGTYGRKSGDAAPLVNPPTKERGGSGHTYRDTPGDLTCPVCGHTAGRPGGLDSHVKNEHGITMAEATGTAHIPCPHAPACTRRFKGNQGLSNHIRIQHGGDPGQAQ